MGFFGLVGIAYEMCNLAKAHGGRLEGGDGTPSRIPTEGVRWTSIVMASCTLRNLAIACLVVQIGMIPEAYRHTYMLR